MLAHRIRRLYEVLTSTVYRRVLLSRFYAFLLRKLNPEITYIGLKDKNTTCFFFLNDNAVTPYSIAMGGFQKDDVSQLIELLKAYKFPLGGVFLDVGANIGTSTLYALESKAFSRAVCFEPAPDNLKLLSLNLHANGLEKIASIQAMAISDKPGRARMELSAKNCGDHRVGATPTSASGLTIEVEVETLDAMLPKLSLKPSDISLVWVDTQGYEANVLAGAKTCIEAKIPFFIEFWPQALQQAGGYEQLLNLIETSFDSYIEVRPRANLSQQPVKTLRSFARKLEGTIYHTDLLLLPKRSQ